MWRTGTSDRGASEAGFTLAGVLVILTVIMVFVAYTVPRQWSEVMNRERDKQTIFIMRQYARAIMEWQKRHGGLPTSLDQLKDARAPRYVRGPKGEWTDPLTGKVDWILIPPNVANTGQPGTPSYVPGSNPSLNPNPQNKNYPGTTTSTTGTSPQQGNVPFPNQQQATSPKDYRGPFVGVRPQKTGKSFIAFNGAETYEQWSYTVQDLANEINARNAAMQLWK